MFKVEYKVLGRYVSHGWIRGEAEALKQAEDYNEEGWLNVRIVDMMGNVTQIYGV